MYHLIEPKENQDVREYFDDLAANMCEFDIHSGNSGKEIEHMYADNKVPIRASTVKTFTDCQFKFFKASVQLTSYGKVNSLASIIGTAIHYGVEMGLKVKIENEAEVDTAYMIACGLEILHNLLFTVDWTKEYLPKNVAEPIFPASVFTQETVEELSDLKTLNLSKYEDAGNVYIMIKHLIDYAEKVVTDGLTEFASELADEIHPTFLERVLTYKFEEAHPVFSGLQGSMDIEEANSVRDVKVTGAKQRAKDHLLQLSVYAYLRNMNGIPTDKVIIDNVIKNKTIKAVTMEIEPNIALVVDIIEQIKTVGARWKEAEQTLASQGLEMKDEDHAEYWTGAGPYYFLCSARWCEHFGTCPHVQPKEIKMF